MIPPPDDERKTTPPGAESHIPGPARMPTGLLTERIDPIANLADRVGDLSDALHSPDGPVHLLIADLAAKGAKREDRAQRRHREVVRLLRHLTTEVVSLNQTVAKLVPEQARHAALLQLVARPDRMGAAE
jgi:hypothetical protein